jgi:hypothetical protein
VEFHGRLVEFHGRLVEFHGRLVEFHGRLVEFHGRLVEFHGRLVEFHGRLVEFNGRYVAVFVSVIAVLFSKNSAKVQQHFVHTRSKSRRNWSIVRICHLYADKLRLTPKYFSKIIKDNSGKYFNRVVGVSPKEYRESKMQ